MEYKIHNALKMIAQKQQTGHRISKWLFGSGNYHFIMCSDSIECRVVSLLQPVLFGVCSLFIRDCQQCRFVLACQQFRTRDCRLIDAFFLCESQPIIESSSKMKFACFKYFYPELEGKALSVECMLSASAALILFCWNKFQCPRLAQPVPLDSVCVCVCVCARARVHTRVCVCVLMEV